MQSMYAMLDGTSDHDLRYYQDWLNHFNPVKPDWHRGIVWPDDIQAKWVQAWRAGDVSLNVAVGRHERYEETSLFLDGMNSFNAVRRALEGELVLPDGPITINDRSLRLNTMKVRMYRGTAEELRRCSYILNRGSPLPWTTEQLPR